MGVGDSRKRARRVAASDRSPTPIPIPFLRSRRDFSSASRGPFRVALVVGLLVPLATPSRASPCLLQYSSSGTMVWPLRSTAPSRLSVPGGSAAVFACESGRHDVRRQRAQRRDGARRSGKPRRLDDHVASVIWALRRGTLDLPALSASPASLFLDEILVYRARLFCADRGGFRRTCGPCPARGGHGVYLGAGRAFYLPRLDCARPDRNRPLSIAKSAHPRSPPLPPSRCFDLVVDVERYRDSCRGWQARSSRKERARPAASLVMEPRGHPPELYHAQRDAAARLELSPNSWRSIQAIERPVDVHGHRARPHPDRAGHEVRICESRGRRLLFGRAFEQSVGETDRRVRGTRQERSTARRRGPRVRVCRRSRSCLLCPNGNGS